MYACSHGCRNPVLTSSSCSLPNLPSDSLLIGSTNSLAANYDLILVVSQLKALHIAVTSEEWVPVC